MYPQHRGSSDFNEKYFLSRYGNYESAWLNDPEPLREVLEASDDYWRTLEQRVDQAYRSHKLSMLVRERFENVLHARRAFQRDPYILLEKARYDPLANTDVLGTVLTVLTILTLNLGGGGLGQGGAGGNPELGPQRPRIQDPSNFTLKVGDNGLGSGPTSGGGGGVGTRVPLGSGSSPKGQMTPESGGFASDYGGAAGNNSGVGGAGGRKNWWE